MKLAYTQVYTVVLEHDQKKKEIGELNFLYFYFKQRF